MDNSIPECVYLTVFGSTRESPRLFLELQNAVEDCKKSNGFRVMTVLKFEENSPSTNLLAAMASAA
jgi:uncharacterized protein (DUF302 family)